MEQSIQTAAFIYGLISLVTLIVFFVMADNVSQIKKSLNQPNSNIGKSPEESTGWLYIEPAVEDPERAAIQPSQDLTSPFFISIIIAIIVFVGLVSIPACNKRDETHQADAALQNQVSTVQVKMCTKCNIEIPLTRAKLGYVDCIDCCSKIVATTRH
jgi:hypothetical protein